MYSNSIQSRVLPPPLINIFLTGEAAIKSGESPSFKQSGFLIKDLLLAII